MALEGVEFERRIQVRRGSGGTGTGTSPGGSSESTGTALLCLSGKGGIPSHIITIWRGDWSHFFLSEVLYAFSCVYICLYADGFLERKRRQ